MGDIKARLQHRTRLLIRKVSGSIDEAPSAASSPAALADGPSTPLQPLPSPSQDATASASSPPVRPSAPMASIASSSAPHGPSHSHPHPPPVLHNQDAAAGGAIDPSNLTMPSNPHPPPQTVQVDLLDSSPKSSKPPVIPARSDLLDPNGPLAEAGSIRSSPSPIPGLTVGRLTQLRESTVASSVTTSDPDSDQATTEKRRRKKFLLTSGDSRRGKASGKAAARLAAEHPDQLLRKQSLISSSNAHFIQALLEDESALATPEEQRRYITAMTKEMHRKIWVKRPGASPTLVQVQENDQVDSVRDMILKKYANSLGRHFDAPDLTLRIVSRDDPPVERTLGPDEEVCSTLDTYFPGGQTVDEALIIDIPKARTPRQSPRHTQIIYYDDPARPFEHSGDYFPPMPPAVPSPAAGTTVSHESRHSRDLSLTQTHNGGHGHSHHHAHGSFDQTRSMSVLSTGQVPPLPSPGGTRRTQLARPNRPPNSRQPTASPILLGNAHRPPRPRHDSTSSDRPHRSELTTVPTISTPPTEHPPPAPQPNSRPGTPRMSSPRPKGRRRLRPRSDGPGADGSLPSRAPMTLAIPTIETSMPPINVLIVEDNHINLKLLEQFIRRLKVRWATAQNGREALNKWRAGGFHLVLMDIQLPVMSGLEATKEIRRLERVNGIGVLANSTPTPREEKSVSEGGLGNALPEVLAEVEKQATGGHGHRRKLSEDDRLADRSLFKSPVIIVALTASNLQSDRHEALAAGCNDFLTKPVNFVWLERKVKEWGCMQALIDYDGWRQWKDFSNPDEAAEKKKAEKEKNENGR